MHQFLHTPGSRDAAFRLRTPRSQWRPMPPSRNWSLGGMRAIPDPRKPGGRLFRAIGMPGARRSAKPLLAELTEETVMEALTAGCEPTSRPQRLICVRSSTPVISACPKAAQHRDRFSDLWIGVGDYLSPGGELPHQQLDTTGGSSTLRGKIMGHITSSLPKQKPLPAASMRLC